MDARLLAIQKALLWTLGDRLDGEGKLVIIPEGALSLLPYAALSSRGGPLIESYDIVMTHGLRALAKPPVDQTDLQGGVVVGLSEFGAAVDTAGRGGHDFMSLPSVEEECRYISKR